MKVHLLIVDPQNDFCVPDDGKGNKGKLVVGGADKDMSRLTAMINRLGVRIYGISVTMDSHQRVGIERPTWWKRYSDGVPPAPFTILGMHTDGKRIVKILPPNMDVTEEEYIPVRMDLLDMSRDYLKKLATAKRYPHVVWPVHCEVPTWGWSVVPELAEALGNWEETAFRKHLGRVTYVVKGNNPTTEHFSGVKAEVPDPSDPSTTVNTGLVQVLEESDIVVIAGEALSHCVANTVRDIVSAFSKPEYVKKLVLLTDASSNVGGFEFLGTAFVKDLTAMGMTLSTTTEFMK